MSLARLSPALVVVLFILAGCAGTGSVEPPPAAMDAEQRAAALAAFDEVWRTVRDQHWDDSLDAPEWEERRARARAEVAAAETPEAARAATAGLLASMGLSHFGIFAGSAAALDEGEAVEPVLAAGGSGWTGARLSWVEGRAMVVDVDPNSPAGRSGVQRGFELERAHGFAAADLLAALTATPMTDQERLFMTEAALQHFSGGRPGESAAFTFRDRDDRVRELDLRFVEEPGELFRMTEAFAMHVDHEARLIDDEVGYFRLSAFADPEGVMPAFAEAMRGFAGTRGVVIDLRGNPGGIGAMAMGIAGYFVADREAVLGEMIMRDNTIRFAVPPQAVIYPGHLAILIDERSASTSEILAAGLKDLDRARLFGRTTAGAALPSQIIELANGDVFQYAVADFVRPSGARIEGVGVAPDVEVTHTRRALRDGEDAALAAALAWIRSAPARLDEAPRAAAEGDEAPHAGGGAADFARAAPGLPPADEVVARHVAAIGGRARLEAVRSYHMKGRLDLGRMLPDRPVESWYQVTAGEPGFRTIAVIDLGSMGMAREAVVDGVAWSHTAMTGASLSKGAELRARISGGDLKAYLTPERHWRSWTTTERLERDGRTVLAVEMANRDGEVETVWFDEETGRIAGSRGTTTSPIGTLTLTTAYEGWVDAGGLSFPKVTRIEGMGEPYVTRIEEVRVDVDVPDEVFTPPAAVQALLEG